MAHPDRVALALPPDPLEQGRILRHQHLGAAEFAVVPGLHRAAELLRHRLLAVADAEHRDAGLVDRLGGKRRVLVEHRGRPPDRITPFGRIALKASSAFWNGTISQ